MLGASEHEPLVQSKRHAGNQRNASLARIQARREKQIDLVLDDQLPASEAKEELLANAKRRDELDAQLRIADEPLPLLHPSMADLYRTKVEQLAAALQREDSRIEASETLRGLIDSIVVTPEGGQLRIELRGNLAAMFERRPTNETVAGTWRPARAGTVGCGGSQPPLLAALERGGMTGPDGSIFVSDRRRRWSSSFRLPFLQSHNPGHHRRAGLDDDGPKAYACLSAAAGSTRMARRAGTYIATSATTASTSGEMMKVRGSRAVTPKSKD